MTNKKTRNPIPFPTIHDDKVDQMLEDLDREQLLHAAKMYYDALRIKTEQERKKRNALFDASTEQLSLFNEAEAINDHYTREEEDFEQKEEEIRIVHRKKKKKRTIFKALENIPVKEKIEADVEQDLLAQYAQHKELKPTIYRELVYRPATVHVREVTVHNYACTDRNGNTVIVSGKNPSPKMIEKSYVSPELASHIIHNKVILGLPLYRQEQEWKRQGLELNRTTMANWMIRTAQDYIEPLAGAIMKDFRRLDVVHMDETTLQVNEIMQNGGNKKCTMVVGCSGPAEEKQMAVYHYEETKEQTFVKDVLGDHFEGALESDGAPAYGNYPCGKHLMCNAHARRKFVEAIKIRDDYMKEFKKLKSRKEKEAYLSQAKHEGLRRLIEIVELYDKLYRIETEGKKAGIGPEEMKKLRQAEEKPVFEELVVKVKEAEEGFPKNSAAYNAAVYFLNREKELKEYTEDGRYPIDNNAAERKVKPFVMARKGFLFAQTESGAKATAACFTVMESAVENKLNPEKYLAYVLDRLRKEGLKDDVVEELLPYSKKLPKELYIEK